MTRLINVKTILNGSATKVDPWFGTSYTINLYRGCSHGCIYCDSRSKCYQIDDFDNIQVKQNAIELLNKELRAKKKRGTIGFGSMNDCYMPIEKQLNLTRQALDLAVYYRFPVHIITKGTLVLRDIDLLKAIAKVYAAVSITITTANDALASSIEPNAPLPSERFETIKTLSDAGIYCGITLMPVLPFITDSFENTEQLIVKARQAGAQYIIGGFGLTLRDGNREYYYQQLDRHFPGLKDQYMKQFGDRYNCFTEQTNKAYKHFKMVCKENLMATKMQFYQPPQSMQGTLF
ncbi:radical SAM protein [Carboxylicivirga sediminis]|uniref:Radical SAM protein n=1 Tax=Carboxylicivirga sediminis TaxID=2006564 RepID=A0A941F2M3_9BACT|nr:radical SAM protein [Carboxylicivirga sediminis]MBR8535252.1 radical SAM protein [Carboxylicivirga sediminis]